MTKYKKEPCPKCERMKVREGKRLCSRCESRITRGSNPEDSTPQDFQSQIKYDKELLYYKAQSNLFKQKYKEALKQSNSQEQILEFNRLAVQSLPVIPKWTLPKYNKEKTKESAVLVASCWHIGETINKEEMGGLNEYNFDIFCNRFQYLVDKTVSFTLQNMSAHEFDTLHVLFTGDMVSGIIHDELEASNELNIVEQAYLGALVTAQGLVELASAFPEVVATCVVGNHGRVKQKKYFKNKQQVNWDYVFYQTLGLMLRNHKNITFNVPLSFWAGIQIQGWNFMIQHGDMIKSWGGIPFYGLNREASKWMEIKASQGEFFHYFVASHFHTKAILQSPVGEKIMNGSLKGGDEYAAGLGLYSDPIQLLFGVHKKYGKSWELSINTKNSEPSSRYKYDRATDLISQATTIK